MPKPHPEGTGSGWRAATPCCLPTLYYGLGDALGAGADLSLSAGIRRFSYWVGSGVNETTLLVGADALSQIAISADEVKVYVGGGAALTGGTGRESDVYGLAFGVSVKALAEHRVSLGRVGAAC